MADIDDERDDIPAVIAVRRAVYDEGMRLYEDEKAGRLGGDKCFWAAERKAEVCKAAGDEAGSAFWREVQKFLFEYDVCAEDQTKVVILEAGETYDYKNLKVIRPGNDPPRNDKGC
jgi:hypothetical protein